MNTLRPAAPSSEGAGFAAVLCRLDVPESVSEANLGTYGSRPLTLMISCWACIPSASLLR